MKNKVFKTMYAVALAASISATSVGGVLPTTLQVVSAASYTINNGRVSVGGGTATIKIQGNEGQTLAGKKFELIRLFEAENSDGGESINYTFDAAYANSIKAAVAKALNKANGTSLMAADVTEYMAIDYIQSLNHHRVDGANADQTLEGSYSSFRYFVEDLRDQIKKDGVSGDIFTVTTADANNAITFEDLKYGYYLVDEITANEGTHQASSLCMVNTANPSAQVQIKSDYPSVTKKIQEDDNRNTIGDSGWNDVADYEIGQTVPYRYDSNIPNMNGYDTYYYAWHDVMDEALTFNPDSVSITIKEGDKSYTLAKSEFKITENPGNGETFKVEVPDIKKIVDTNFPANINGDNENVYGQDVILTYNATLNENAAADTGRPGFENDVRLEFSNDADGDGAGETGYTPWDTVVCFTFQLDVKKVNDRGARPLEGAKFRLYSDAECKNEVYVQDMGNNKGYTVLNRDALGGNDHTGGSNPTKAVEMSSNADGDFIIYGLDSGTYYLKETKAPAGYRQLLDPIVLNLRATYTRDRNSYIKGEGATAKTLQNFETDAHIKSFYDGRYIEEDQALTTDVDAGSANLSVVNKVGQKLPITGSSLALIMTGAGAVMMTLGLRKGKKKANGEQE